MNQTTTHETITCERCGAITDDWMGDYCSACWWERNTPPGAELATIDCPHCGNTVDQWIHGICCECHDTHCDCIWPAASYGITPDAHPHLFPRLKSAALTAALFLALPLTSHAQTPTFQHPVYPTAQYLAGCEIMEFEDGSRLAECDDGARLAYDSDGNRWINEAGMPIRAPGWYVIN